MFKMSPHSNRKSTVFRDAGMRSKSEFFHFPAVWPRKSYSTSLSSGFLLRNQRSFLAFRGGWGPEKEIMPMDRLPRARHSAGAPWGFLLPALTSPLKRVPVWRLQSAGTDRQSPRGNCGFTKNRPFDQMIKSLSYANAWTGWTLGQFSRSKLQLIFEEIACSLAFPQLCHTVSHTAAFVTARTNWNT